MPKPPRPTNPADVARFLAEMESFPLPLVILKSGRGFVRFIKKPRRNLLGTGPSSGRFSDPRRGTVPDTELFHVLYAAYDPRTAFEETVLRDKRADRHGRTLLTRAELEIWRGGLVHTRRPLKLVDLRETEGGWRSLGMTIEELKGASYRVTQQYSRAFHLRSDALDGIVYSSRYAGEPNIAIFGRAISTGLRADPVRPVLDFELAPIFRKLGVEIVEDPPEDDGDGE